MSSTEPARAVDDMPTALRSTRRALRQRFAEE